MQGFGKSTSPSPGLAKNIIPPNAGGFEQMHPNAFGQLSQVLQFRERNRPTSITPPHHQNRHKTKDFNVNWHSIIFFISFSLRRVDIQIRKGLRMALSKKTRSNTISTSSKLISSNNSLDLMTRPSSISISCGRAWTLALNSHLFRTSMVKDFTISTGVLR